LDNHVTAEQNCPVLSAGTGTNAQKTANTLMYEISNLSGWEAAYIESPAPKPKHNGNDLFWAVALGSNVRVFWRGGSTTISVSDALTDAENFGFDNDNYIKKNVDYQPGDEPPPPPGGGPG
jgi:hypothetical protein